MVVVTNEPVQFDATDQLVFFEALECLGDRPSCDAGRLVNLLWRESQFGVLSEE